MKSVYEPANAIEGHMIVNMLEQHGIQSRLEGEHLPSAAGELPVAGLLRIVADEADYDRAREIILQWEAKSPGETVTRQPSKSAAPMWFMAGVVVAIAVMAIFNRLNVSYDGVDHNGDGKLDERYTYSGNFLSRWESDRDFDGKADYIFEYDSKGNVERSREDANFDGRFEISSAFVQGSVKRSTIDWDGDGAIDIRQDFINGVISNATYLVGKGSGVKRRERYEGGRLVEAEIDKSGDGVVDTYERYDWSGEVIDSRRL